MRKPHLAFFRSERGGVAVLAGMVLICLLGSAAIAVDAAYLFLTRSRLQATADAAALAAVRALPDQAAARAAAMDLARRNMPMSEHGDVVVPGGIELGKWTDDTRTFTVDSSSPNAVRIFAARDAANGNPVLTFFGKVLRIHDVDVRASAVAAKPNPAVCLLALHPTAEKSIEISGGGAMVGQNCEIHVHSSASKATNLSGGSTITGSRICIAGSSSGSGYSPAAENGCTPRPDPLKDLVPPTVDACDHYNLKFGGVTVNLLPGVYCGGLEMSGGGTLDLSPGVYIMKNGPLTTSGGSIIRGAGVGIYLVGTNTYVNTSGGGGVTLSAAGSGPMAGVIFFQDAASNVGAESHFSGGTNSRYEGAVYFPKQTIRISGGGTATVPPPLTIFIASRFIFTGGSRLELQANAAASSVPLPPGMAGSSSRLLR